MIFFLTTQANRFPIDDYLFSWGKDILRAVQPIDYEQFLEFRSLRPGVYIFSDLELITAEQRQKAVHQWDALRAMGQQTHLINHPTQSIRRYDLLKKLRENQMNRFTIYRYGENLSGIRFPAFVRNENDHLGSSSGLITTMKDLTATIDALINNSSDPKNLLITEFCDTGSPDKIYRKYSSFILDGAIIPRHIFFSHNWHLKKEDLYTGAYFQEELNYVQTNPHEQGLKKIFGLAGINYGRIDYGVKDGQIQVWEINTNPVILSPRTPTDTQRVEIHRTFNRNFQAQWKTLAQKYSALSGNYAGERQKLYRKMWAVSPEADKIRKGIQQTKIKIAAAFPPVLKLYKQIKKIAGR